MTSIADQIYNSLKTVNRPGDFYATGTIDVFLPQLDVTGVGRIALPLLPVQAEQLVAIAEQAPYGRGYETLVDTEVRRTWQIDANQVMLKGKHWQETVQSIVNRCTTGLGVSGKVNAELYKLLVYDAGSFFTRHRDTEKTPGMFATLVIVLPSEYQGGELVIKHQQQAVTLDLRCNDASEIAFAAFYADCVHEVLPITQGCRLTLIYNLVRINQQLPLPRPPDYHQEQVLVAELLGSWTDSLRLKTNSDKPEKLIYLLEHAYTPAELGFDTLKNADAAVAEVLAAAAEQADCELHLALVSAEESGSAEYSGGYGRKRGRYWDDEPDEDDFEIGEVIERTETISEWRRMDGNVSTLPELPFNANEFCPMGAFENIEPDDIEFQEATGNEGASFERTYQCAALVIWPRSFNLAIISKAGLIATLPMLIDFCQRWEAEGRDSNSTLWQDAHTLARCMLRDDLGEIPGNQNGCHIWRSDREFLECLYCLSDRDCINSYWHGIALRGFYIKEDSAALVQTATLLPWPRVVSHLEEAISLSAPKAQEACAALLACFCAAMPDTAKDLSKAAQVLFAALPGDPNRFSELQPWERARINVNSDLVVEVLTSFSVIDATLAENALDYFLAWPAVYAMDSILVLAALSLAKTNKSLNFPVIGRLNAAVIRHINTRVSRVLEPPMDWRRENKISCPCQDCTALRLFLDHPTESKWTFKAAETRRSHIEQSIKKHQSDINCKTECTSRPYSLVCVKNQASYQRLVAQHTRDLNILASLGVT